MTELNKLKKELNGLGSKKQAEILSRFFKTGKGQYGEGDIFLGIKVPVQREVAKKYDLSLSDIQKLISSKIHDYRMVALFILIAKYKESNKVERKKIFKLNCISKFLVFII